MGRFAGLRAAAPPSKGGNFFSEGEYEATVKEAIYKKLNDGGNALIVEFIVTKSNNPAIAVGAERSWFQKENKSFLSEAKGFLYAGMGFDLDKPEHKTVIESKIDPKCEEIMDDVIDKQILKGRAVAITVIEKPQKGDATKNFNKHMFKPAPGTAPMGG